MADTCLGQDTSKPPQTSLTRTGSPWVREWRKYSGYRCGFRGHKAVNCSSQAAKHCCNCGNQGHEERNCRYNDPKSGLQSNASPPWPKGQFKSAGCLVQTPPLQASPEEIQSCIKDDQLLLACGKKVPLLCSKCVQPLSGARSKMPVVKGRVAEKTVDVLRDTGCSGIVVKRNLVTEEQYLHGWL